MTDIYAKATEETIEEQREAFKAAHDRLQKAGEFTEFELNVILRTGDAFLAAAELAIASGKGLIVLEVQALLDQAQTAAMIMIGATHEGEDKDSDLRNFYRRTQYPIMKKLQGYHDQINKVA